MVSSGRGLGWTERPWIPVDSLDAWSSGRVNRNICGQVVGCRSSNIHLWSWLPLQFLVNSSQYLLHSFPPFRPRYLGRHGQYRFFLPFATSSHHSSSPYPKRKYRILGKPCAVQTRASKISRVGKSLYRVTVTLSTSLQTWCIALDVVQ